MATRERTKQIREFIVQMVESHPTDIAHVVSEKFKITTQAARNHLLALERKGVLTSSGQTRAKSFELVRLAQVSQAFNAAGLEEDVVWRKVFLPKLTGMSDNVSNLCTIAFGEMLNNAIDHSESDEIFVQMNYTAAAISITITDRGIGIFRKVKDALNLPEERMAILELSKGKLTTAPATHSGLGIFFTSRMVDLFSIRSGQLFFHHATTDHDWLIETGTQFDGTQVDFTVSTASDRTAADVYNTYCSDPNGDENAMPFRKTHVPLSLAQWNKEPLVSRSQAKRVLARLDKFAEVLIDFSGVELVGQAFADEIFRVFPSSHPDVHVIAVNANRQISQMINLSRSNGQKRLFDVDDETGV